MVVSKRYSSLENASKNKDHRTSMQNEISYKRIPTVFYSMSYIIIVSHAVELHIVQYSDYVSCNRPTDSSPRDLGTI